MERELVQVNIAVLAIADAQTSAGDAIGKLIVDRLTEAGHRVIARETVKDSVQQIRAHFLSWIADPDIDVVLVTKGLDTVATTDALEPLVTRPLAGFRDLFRMLSYEEIGTAAMLIDVDAAQCGSTYVFVLPSSNGAVRTALDRILLPQLDHRTKPHNLVMRMPRLRNELARLPTEGPNAPPARPTPEPGAPRPTAKTPTQKLALPWITPAPPAIPAVVKKEITAVGPPPPPSPRRPTTNNPVPPDGPIARPAIEPPPAAPEPAAEPASMAPPAKPSEPAERVPTLDELATPLEPSADSVKPINLETLSRIIDSATANTTTGTIITNSELPVFGGEDFTHRTPRTSHRKLLLVSCGLALVAAATVGATAMIGERSKAGPRDPRVAAVKPPPVRPEVPPSAPSPPPAPEPTPELPELEIADTPVASPEIPETPRAKPVAVRRRPPGPTTTPPAGSGLAPPADDGCDEVECILQSYKRACCQRFKPVDPGVRPSSGLPEVLDRSMIAAGVATMKPVVIRCGEKSGVTGTVRLTVDVAASGRVQEVSVASSPDAALGDCVAAAMRKVTFGRTETGGTFQYPYVF